MTPTYTPSRLLSYMYKDKGAENSDEIQNLEGTQYLTRTHGNSLLILHVRVRVRADSGVLLCMPLTDTFIGICHRIKQMIIFISGKYGSKTEVSCQRLLTNQCLQCTFVSRN